VTGAAVAVDGGMNGLRLPRSRQQSIPKDPDQ
jgi:hypothetical protein